jgi:hypothetical protein
MTRGHLYESAYTCINGRIETVLATMVRVASGAHLFKPIRNPTIGVASNGRAEMERGHHERLGPRWVYRTMR